MPFSDICVARVKVEKRTWTRTDAILVIEKLGFTQENPVDLNSVGGWMTGHKLSPNANQYEGQLETPQSVTVDRVIRI
jgi:hypothetical protein